ncbi:VOC family protein [Falsirhodobacter algicola]|uniref:Aldoketomutase n=1 Tax=Falsirhodobacter algicola TaxID=2692330 RepID=A0A8J8MV78_9RHOB|nr:VOC family protein [Falsirhodobacter algicola]QUS37305.1 lactoylglutathione lyase [Falsirhodobacter algicola]
MAKLVHSMIRVLDEARSVAFYDRAFGLKVADRLDFEGFTLVYLSNPEAAFELELTVNKGRTEPYDIGDGYGHIAVVVEDLDAEHARLTAAGFAPRRIVDFRNDGAPVARFFFIADPDGYEIEVIARGGRFGGN